jgi:hypothetical protein
VRKRLQVQARKTFHSTSLSEKGIAPVLVSHLRHHPPSSRKSSRKHITDTSSHGRMNNPRRNTDKTSKNLDRDIEAGWMKRLLQGPDSRTTPEFPYGVQKPHLLHRIQNLAENPGSTTGGMFRLAYHCAQRLTRSTCYLETVSTHYCA